MHHLWRLRGVVRWGRTSPVQGYVRSAANWDDDQQPVAGEPVPATAPPASAQHHGGTATSALRFRVYNHHHRRPRGHGQRDRVLRDISAYRAYRRVVWPQLRLSDTTSIYPRDSQHHPQADDHERDLWRSALHGYWIGAR